MSNDGEAGLHALDATLLDHLKAALDVTSEGVVVWDEGGREIFRNARASLLLDRRLGGALGEQALHECLRAALEGSRPEQLVELFAPTRRNLIVRAYPQRGPDGARGAVAVVSDESDRRRLESIRRDFVANVSHELKTPVGALCLLAETLDGEEDPEVVARLASRVSGEATRLANIIDDLLDLSRIEANEVPEREELPVAAVLDAVMGPLGRLAERKGVEMIVDKPDKSLTVLGDRRDLASAVSNLVDNAVKFSEPGGEVRVEVAEHGQWVQVRVVDQGVGIPPRDLERIFERFYRVDRARSRSSGGSGLGLSIVRHVAANHGGSVSVTSVEGEGSTFVLTLPLAGIMD